jgi:DNA-binding winged helix-turn-helix (wHTH) protein
VSEEETMSFRFGDFELDEERRQLLRSGEPVPLEPKAYELLSLLVERRPRALSRAQIRDAIWPQTFVSDSTLAGVVNGFRQALGDGKKAAQIPEGVIATCRTRLREYDDA